MDPAAEDSLAEAAVALVAEVRSAPTAARHRLRALDKLGLEQHACVLAAFVPPNRAPRGLLRQLAVDIRDDLAAAHRAVRHMPQAELERVCLALAEVVPDDIPLAELAWWRTHPTVAGNGSVAA